MEHLVTTEIARYGYLAVFVLMVLESACIPVPSEVVMLFGGAMASGATLAGVHGHLDLWLVASIGVAGNLVGSITAYVVGRVGGRPFLERYGRWVLVRPRHLDRADGFFHRYGRRAVFFGRMLPVVRTFVSVPAGVAKMPILPFAALTAAGSVPWVLGLTVAGSALAAHWQGLAGASTPISIGALVAAALVGGLWLNRRRSHLHVGDGYAEGSALEARP